MQTNFDTPAGADPVALDLASMGKGQAWVNGHHIGRYWTLVAPKDGCQDVCDYRGAYNSDKCTTNCGKATQTLYISILKHKQQKLVKTVCQTDETLLLVKTIFTIMHSPTYNMIIV